MHLCDQKPHRLRHRPIPPPSAHRHIAAETENTSERRPSLRTATRQRTRGKPGVRLRRRGARPIRRHTGSCVGSFSSKGISRGRDHREDLLSYLIKLWEVSWSCALFLMRRSDSFFRLPDIVARQCVAFPVPGKAAISSPAHSFLECPRSVRKKIRHTGAAQSPAVAAQATRGSPRPPSATSPPATHFLPASCCLCPANPALADAPDWLDSFSGWLQRNKGRARTAAMLIEDQVTHNRKHPRLELRRRPIGPGRAIYPDKNLLRQILCLNRIAQHLRDRPVDCALVFLDQLAQRLLVATTHAGHQRLVVRVGIVRRRTRHIIRSSARFFMFRCLEMTVTRLPLRHKHHRWR